MITHGEATSGRPRVLPETRRQRREDGRGEVVGRVDGRGTLQASEKGQREGRGGTAEERSGTTQSREEGHRLGSRRLNRHGATANPAFDSVDEACHSVRWLWGGRRGRLGRSCLDDSLVYDTTGTRAH